jgi:hypothetical protein
MELCNSVACRSRTRGPRPFIVQWKFANLLPIACARDLMADVRRYSAVSCRTRERPLAMFNETQQSCCQSHAREALGHVQCNFANLLPIACARDPMADVRRCSAVSCRTRERLLAMFNATLQICCQSHAHETPWPMFDGALRFLVARARGPWPCSMELCSFAASHARARPLADVRLNLQFDCLSPVGWLAGEVAWT